MVVQAEMEKLKGLKRKRPPPAHEDDPEEHTKGARQAQSGADKRAEKKQKLAKRKKNYSLIQDVVAKWEIVRRHDADPAQQGPLITEIVDQVRGHIVELAMSHTGSRVIQALVKLGTPDQREAIIEEVMPSLVTLSKSPYAHFFVVRLIAKASPKTLEGVMKAFQGHVPGLLRHPCGASVIAELYSGANTKQRNLLTSEFYGKEFVVFGQGNAPASLAALFKDRDPRTARAVIQRMAIALIPIMEKGMLDPPIVHRVIAEYLSAAPISAVREAVETLSGPALLRCVHTHSGAAIACTVLAYATPKDRKKTVKGMKGHVKALGRDQWAHSVLLAALLRVDDTQLLSKVVMAELQANLDEVISHKYGRHILLQLLAPGSPRYLPPHLHSLLHPGRLALPVSSTEDKSANEGEEPALGESKKSMAVKMRELLEGGKPSFAKALTGSCVGHVSDLLRGPPAADILVEVARGGDAGVLQSIDPEGVAALHEAILAEASAEPKPAVSHTGDAGDEKFQGHVLDDYYGSRGLRRLVLATGEEGPSGNIAGGFTTGLWTRAFKGRCKEWLTSHQHALKVLAAIWHVSSGQQRADVEAELQPLLKEPVAAWAETCLHTGPSKPMPS